MGSDIHLFAEAKRNGKWETLDKWSDDPDYPEHTTKQKIVRWDRPDDSGNGAINDYFYTGGRNYNLFCALAGARKYQFTGNPPQVSEPKGIPEDCCTEIKEEYESWRSDAHTESWLTLKELKDFDWSSYGDTCDDFRNEVLPKMESAIIPSFTGDNYESVRIVFWFDN